jgi:Tfp pilus assembly protein PilO
LSISELIKKLDWTRLTLRERILAILTVAVVGIGIILLFLTPVKELNKQGQEKIKTLRDEINQTQAVVSELKSKIQEVRRARGNEETEQGVSPDLSDVMLWGDHLSSFLEQLTRLGHQHGVDFLMLRPEVVSGNGDYLELNLQMTVRSRFRQLGEYLMKLENQPRAMIVEGIKIETSTETTPYITAHLKTSVYMKKN